MKHLSIYIIALTLPCFTLQADVKACIAEGLFCESCRSLVRCTSTGNDSWSKTEQGTCRSPSKCLLGECTEDPEPICDGTADVAFPCQQVGIFPHPFYCNKFVLCVDDWGLKAYVNDCEEGYGFDIATKECDTPLTGNQCVEKEYPVPVCEKLLQTGPLEEDNTLFYTCKEVNKGLFEKVLYPLLDRCPHGQVYTEVDGCQDSPDTTIAPTPTTVPGTTNPATTIPSTTV